MSLDEQKNITEVGTEEDDSLFSSFEDVNDTSKKQSKLSAFITSPIGILVTVITTVVLIAGIVLLIIFDPFSKPDTTTPDDPIAEDTTITLMDKSKKNEVIVQRVDIQNESGTYSILYDKNEDLFYLEGYADVLLSTAMSDQLQEYTAKLIAIEKIDDGHSLKDYGLDKPTSSVKVTFTDKSTTTIQVGNETPDKTGYYVSTDAAEGVYIFESDAVLLFTYSKTAFVDVTLISTPTVKSDDADGKALLKQVSYSGSAYPTPLVVRRSYQTDSEEMGLFSYIITKPYQRGTNDTVSSMLGTFTGLYAEQALVIKPTATEKKAMGFDDPLTVMEVVMAVETSDKENQDKIRYYNETVSTVTIGSMDDNNYVVMVDGLDIIFLVEKSSLSALAERTYENTVNPLLFAKNITDVSRISISIEDVTYDFALKHFDTENNDTSLKVTVDGTTYPTDDFRELYTILMTLERYGSSNQKPTGTPVMSVKMYNTDGSLYMGAEYYSLDGSLCYVKTTEGETFTTRWHYVTHFTEQVKNYINGEKVMLLT